MQVDLLEFVTRQVHAYDGSLTQLARDSGVKASWLAMFKRGHIPNPGVQQIQKLADHFHSSGHGIQQQAAYPNDRRRQQA